MAIGFDRVFESRLQSKTRLSYNLSSPIKRQAIPALIGLQSSAIEMRPLYFLVVAVSAATVAAGSGRTSTGSDPIYEYWGQSRSEHGLLFDCRNNPPGTFVLLSISVYPKVSLRSGPFYDVLGTGEVVGAAALSRDMKLCRAMGHKLVLRLTSEARIPNESLPREIINGLMTTFGASSNLSAEQAYGSHHRLGERPFGDAIVDGMMIGSSSWTHFLMAETGSAEMQLINMMPTDPGSGDLFNMVLFSVSVPNCFCVTTTKNVGSGQVTQWRPHEMALDDEQGTRFSCRDKEYEGAELEQQVSRMFSGSTLDDFHRDMCLEKHGEFTTRVLTLGRPRTRV